MAEEQVLTEEQALEILEKEYPELRKAWEQRLKDGKKATEILEFYREFL